MEDEAFAAIIKEAEKYLGFPYVWGGSSPATSFDCSGFVSYVYNNCGVGWSFGRLSAEGIRQICSYVSPADAKPGDLIFFEKTYNTTGASHITVAAAQQGKATISLKGKIHTILLSTKLCRKLLKYAKKQKIATGEIFLTSSGKGISRRQVWHELKRLCAAAGVESSKVFPHNFRRLFAVTYYKASRDIARLADVLGHSSIETTRIYLTVSGADQARQLDRLGLVS